MATNKNFEIKNGLTIAGTERISSDGAFTGSLASATTATTQSAADSSTKIATTAYTDAAITAVIGGAPGTLDTLNELAAAINDDASYASTLTTALATKAPLASPTFTGTITGTLATAAQTNITSVGSLTALTGGTGDLNWDSGTLFVDSSANAVGIGTSSPASKLHIFDGGSSVNNTITFGNPSATPKAEIHHTAGGNEFLNISCKGTTSGFGNIAFYTGATPDERMVIDSSGNVGIGASASLDSSLNLNNNQAFARVLAADNSGTLRVGIRHTANNSNSLVIMGATHNTYYPASFVVDSSYASNRTTYDLTAYGVAYSGWNGAMSFKISNGASTVTEMLSLTTAGAVFPTGNVGIGQSVPAHKLDILTSTDQEIPLRIKNSDSDSHTYMRFEDNGGQYWDTGINYANNDYYFNYGGAFRARLTNAGGLELTDTLAASTNGNQTLLLESIAGGSTIHFRTGNGSISTYIQSGLGGTSNQSFNVGGTERLNINSSGYITTYAGPMFAYTVEPSGTNTILLLWNHESWSSSFSGSIQLNNWDGKSSHDIFFGPDYNTNASPSIYGLRHYGSTISLLRVTYSGTIYLALKNNGATNRTWLFNGINSGEVPLMALVPESSVTINNTFATY